MAKLTKAAALDAALKTMFRSLETRPMPLSVRVIVEQLEQPAVAPLRKAARRFPSR